MTMSQGFLSSVDTTTAGLEEIGDRDGEIMRTEISTLSTSWEPATSTLEVSLRNAGQVKLRDFGMWDFIIQYYDAGSTYYVEWLPYVEGALGDNQWRKKGIYSDAASETEETFEPGILNPGEEMVIEAKLNPDVGAGTTNFVAISTANGISATTTFSGP